MITNLKGLAVSWAISHFETYIHGMNFTVITDHSALKALEEKSSLTKRFITYSKEVAGVKF